MGGAPLRRTVSNRVCSRWSYYFVIHSAQAIGCGDRLEGSPKVSFCASLGKPRSKARAIHIHRRVPGKAFSLLVVSNTLRGDLFRVSPGALVNVENAARGQASWPRRRRIWLQTHSNDEFGKRLEAREIFHSRRPAAKDSWEKSMGPCWVGRPDSLNLEVPVYQRLPRSPRSPRSPPRPPP
jgi:hypothetical protein